MKRNFTVLPLLMVLLVAIMIIEGCSNTSSAVSTTTPVSTMTTTTPISTTTPLPTLTISSPSTTIPAPTTETKPLTLQQIADNVAKDVGKVMSVTEVNPEKVVFIFEEVHNSILGQVEIAIMFNRLYSDYGLRHIGLEGQTSQDGVLDLTWAHKAPYYSPNQDITGREDVIIQTLQDGEISAAETLGLLYHDVIIDGIDDAGLYVGAATDEQWNAVNIYLYNIAGERMSATEMTAWQALVDAKKYNEAFSFALGTDEFALDTFMRLGDSINILQDEDFALLLDTIKEEAESLGLIMPADIEADLSGLQNYYTDYVSPRSDAMVLNMLKVVTSHSGAPLAMEIGGAHTNHIQQGLTGAGVSVVVIRALSMDEGTTAGDISAEAYQRKLQGLSVDKDGFLGSLLDGRKKPQPVAGKKFARQEEEIRILLQRLANLANSSAAMGHSPSIIKQDIMDDLHTSGWSTGINDTDVQNVWVEVEMPTGDSYSSTVPIVLFEITLKDGRVIKGMSQGTGAKMTANIENRLEQARDNLSQETQPASETTPTYTPVTTITGSESWQQICSNTVVKWDTSTKTD